MVVCLFAQLQLSEAVACFGNSRVTGCWPDLNKQLHSTLVLSTSPGSLQFRSQIKKICFISKQFETSYTEVISDVEYGLLSKFLTKCCILDLISC